MDDRSKVSQAVRMAFVKDDSLGNLLQLNYKSAMGPGRKHLLDFQAIPVALKKSGKFKPLALDTSAVYVYNT